MRIPEDFDDIYNAPTQETWNLLVQDMISREYGKVAPDTIGADYFFIKGFITPQMALEFPLIEKEFLLHCYSKIKDYEVQEWYGGDMVHYSSPSEAAMQRVFTYIYNGAKSGDEYCIGLIKYLYKIYHKKEHNQLKRFRTITVSELMSLAEDIEGNVPYENMGRVIVMCTFMGIELEERCSILYLLLEKNRQEWLDDAEYYDYEFFARDCFDQCMEQIEQWHKEEGMKPVRKRGTVYREERQFISKSLNFFGYPSEYLYRCMDHFVGAQVQQARTLEILKKLHHNREFTYEEVEHYTQVFGLVEAITTISDRFDEELCYLFGEDIELEGTMLFRPENVTVSTLKVPETTRKKVMANVAPVSMGEAKAEDYLKEIADLRKRLNAKEQDYRHLQDLYRSMKVTQEENERLLADYQNEREELIALREFVYHSTTEEEEELSERTIAERKAVIAEKEIVIIGGHITWINKLRKQFPNWLIIHPDAYRTVDGKMLGGKEHVYFFTDYINHISYNKFIAVVRERSIPFGYLHNRNMKQIICQVYDDLV